MPILFTTAVTAIIGSAVGNYFQKRSFDFTAKATRQTELRAQRNTFINTLMTRISKRVFTLIQVIKIMKDDTLTDAEASQRIQAYEASIEDTLVNYSSDLVFLQKFFDQAVSNQYQQIMQGPGGFVELDKAWRAIYKNYNEIKTVTLPEIEKALEDTSITEEKANELKKYREETLELLNKNISDLLSSAAAFGNSPVGTPFYTTIVQKEDLKID